MKHKYMVSIPADMVKRDSGERVETIAERNKAEFLGSRMTADGTLQVGYSCEPSAIKDIQLYLDCCGLKGASVKDCGKDDGKRGRVTRADTSGKPETKADKKPAKTKRTAKPVVKKTDPTPVVEKYKGVINTLKELNARRPHEDDEGVKEMAEVVGVPVTELACRQSAAFGYFSINRENLYTIMRRKDTSLPKLAYNQLLYPVIEPIIRKVYGKDAEKILKYL